MMSHTAPYSAARSGLGLEVGWDGAVCCLGSGSDIRRGGGEENVSPLTQPLTDHVTGYGSLAGGVATPRLSLLLLILGFTVTE